MGEEKRYEGEASKASICSGRGNQLEIVLERSDPKVEFDPKIARRAVETLGGGLGAKLGKSEK
eukprot:SAG11_NODE_36930_length_259_cov_0.650000_1_plen_63_part_00